MRIWKHIVLTHYNSLPPRTPLSIGSFRTPTAIFGIKDCTIFGLLQAKLLDYFIRTGVIKATSIKQRRTKIGLFEVWCGKNYEDINGKKHINEHRHTITTIAKGLLRSLAKRRQQTQVFVLPGVVWKTHLVQRDETCHERDLMSGSCEI